MDDFRPGFSPRYLSRSTRLNIPLGFNRQPSVISTPGLHTYIGYRKGLYLYDILIYGGNVSNSTPNGLINGETITYIRNSGRFTKLQVFG